MRVMLNTKRPEYRTWNSMKRRVLNPNAHNYKYYGGRGITICDRWVADFNEFLKDMGEKPTPIHTIDRIDNSKGYYPENCRWATKKEQAQNTRERTNSLRVSRSGINGITYHTIWQRINTLNWDYEIAINTPTNTKHRRK